MRCRLAHQNHRRDEERQGWANVVLDLGDLRTLVSIAREWVPEPDRF